MAKKLLKEPKSTTYLFSDGWGDLLKSDVSGELKNWHFSLGELGQGLWFGDLVNIVLEEIDQTLDTDLVAFWLLLVL